MQTTQYILILLFSCFTGWLVIWFTLTILFRPEKDAAAAGHRNLIENNTLTDNGGDDGAAILFEAPACGVVIRGNTLKETRGPASRSAVSVCAGVENLKVEENKVEGFAKDFATAGK